MLKRFICAIAMLILTLNIVPAQSAKQDKDKKDAQATQPRQSAAATGSGTPGHIAKWMNTTALGDSTITEDSKTGNIGIGITLPKSPLSVEGIIETTGGIRFPDGTIQKSASGAVTHDDTLKGDGTPALPLGLAVPLNLIGFTDTSVITVTNTAPFGIGILVRGSEVGLLAFGKNGDQDRGGTGVAGVGGNGLGEQGGDGGLFFGGDSENESGGHGLFVVGGNTSGTNPLGSTGGDGGVFFGGNAGGRGLIVQGGRGDGPDQVSGAGIVVVAGLASNGATRGLAGQFIGNVAVTGTLTKGGGSFKIDHPLDPENKYLSHSFVESPDMKNIYDGNITTDEKGEATVTLPDYFEALNRDFRYQLTVIGTFAQAIVADEIKGSRFVIRTSAPNVKVSWQVTGIRQDAWANKNRIPVEEIKPESERGLYLHPDAFDKPEDRAIESVRRPEIKQRRQAQQARNKQK